MATPVSCDRDKVVPATPAQVVPTTGVNLATARIDFFLYFAFSSVVTAHFPLARTQAHTYTMSSSSSSSHTFRRIITSHDPSDTDGSKVQIFDDTLPMRPVLEGNAHMTPLFAHLDVPATSSHSISSEGIKEAMSLAPSVVTPGGVNGQVTDVAPGFKIGMHRTNSIDYNVFLKGSAWLITPTGDGKEERTLVKAGEVVVQRGTIHAWEATDEGARWCTVVVSALPVEKDGKQFEEVDF